MGMPELDFDQQPIKDEMKLRGYCCPHCGRLVKEYRRHFNSNMALALIFLYRNKEKGFIKLEKEMKDGGYERCGDASYLRHYNLVDTVDQKRKDGSKRNGFYKISGRGIMFCENKTTVKEFFKIYNNKITGFEGKDINIKQALGEKFNYENLMLAI